MRMNKKFLVTRGEKTPERFFTLLEKLQEAGHRASETKSKLFVGKTTWLGHEVNEHGIKPNKEKIKTVLHIKPPTSGKQLESFLAALQFIANFPLKFSEKNDRMAHLLKRTGLELDPGRRRRFLPIKGNDNMNFMCSTFCKRAR